MSPKQEVPGFPYGTRCMAYSRKDGVWLRAHVMESTPARVKIRYSGWGEEEDEWLDKQSDRFDYCSGGSKKWATTRFAVSDGSGPLTYVNGWKRLVPAWLPKGAKLKEPLPPPRQHRPASTSRASQPCAPTPSPSTSAMPGASAMPGPALSNRPLRSHMPRTGAGIRTGHGARESAAQPSSSATAAAAGRRDAHATSGSGAEAMPPPAAGKRRKGAAGRAFPVQIKTEDTAAAAMVGVVACDPAAPAVSGIQRVDVPARVVAVDEAASCAMPLPDPDPSDLGAPFDLEKSADVDASAHRPAPQTGARAPLNVLDGSQPAPNVRAGCDRKRGRDSYTEHPLAQAPDLQLGQPPALPPPASKEPPAQRPRCVVKHIPLAVVHNPVADSSMTCVEEAPPSAPTSTTSTQAAAQSMLQLVQEAAAVVHSGKGAFASELGVNGPVAGLEVSGSGAGVVHAPAEAAVSDDAGVQAGSQPCSSQPVDVKVCTTQSQSVSGSGRVAVPTLRDGALARASTGPQEPASGCRQQAVDVDMADAQAQGTGGHQPAQPGPQPNIISPAAADAVTGNTQQEQQEQAQVQEQEGQEQRQQRQEQRQGLQAEEQIQQASQQHQVLQQQAKQRTAQQQDEREEGVLVVWQTTGASGVTSTFPPPNDLIGDKVQGSTEAAGADDARLLGAAWAEHAAGGVHASVQVDSGSLDSFGTHADLVSSSERQVAELKAQLEAARVQRFMTEVEAHDKDGQLLWESSRLQGQHAQLQGQHAQLWEQLQQAQQQHKEVAGDLEASQRLTRKVLSLALKMQEGMLKAARSLAQLDAQLPDLTGPSEDGASGLGQGRMIIDAQGGLVVDSPASEPAVGSVAAEQAGQLLQELQEVSVQLLQQMLADDDQERELAAAEPQAAHKAEALTALLASLESRHEATEKLLDTSTAAVRAAVARRGVQLQALTEGVQVLVPCQPQEKLCVQRLEHPTTIEVPAGTVLVVPDGMGVLPAMLPSVRSGGVITGAAIRRAPSTAGGSTAQQQRPVIPMMVGGVAGLSQQGLMQPGQQGQGQQGQGQQHLNQPVPVRFALPLAQGLQQAQTSFLMHGFHAGFSNAGAPALPAGLLQQGATGQPDRPDGCHGGSSAQSASPQVWHTTQYHHQPASGMQAQHQTPNLQAQHPFLFSSLANSLTQGMAGGHLGGVNMFMPSGQPLVPSQSVTGQPRPQEHVLIQSTNGS